MPNQTNKRTALLLGASGLVGGYVLDVLLNDPAYGKVVVAVRKKLPLINEKLEQVTVDFEQLGLNTQMFKVDDVFCCLGTTMKQAGSREKFRKVDYFYPVEAAKLALENGASQYLLISSSGADRHSLIFYSKTKGETETAISKLGFGTVHIFRPSLLLGQRETDRVGEKIGEVLLDTLSFALKGPFKKYRGIKASTVAYSMVQCAKQQDTGNHVHESDEIQSIFDKNSPR